MTTAQLYRDQPLRHRFTADGAPTKVARPGLPGGGLGGERNIKGTTKERGDEAGRGPERQSITRSGR